MSRLINRFDDLDFDQRCAILHMAGKKWPISEEEKVALFNGLMESLPPVRKIKSTEEINIGDTLMYTGQPRGTGMFVPKIGELWEMKTDDDLLSASIQIIERGRGWWPLLNSEQEPDECDANPLNQGENPDDQK